MALFQTTVFVACMTAALVWDLRYRRIPNVLTVLAFTAALALRLPMGGSAVLAGLAGAGAALLIGLPLFAFRGLGGGDVKLLAATGAFLGPVDLVWAFLVAGILGGVLGIVTAARRGLLLVLLVNTKDMLLYCLTFGRTGKIRTLATAGALTVPYGVAVALGAMIVWF